MTEERPEKPLTYDTSDQDMCKVLMMAGYTTVDVPKRTGDGRHLVYSFEMEKVQGTIDSILSGNADNMYFSYTDWWKAEMTWRMNLRHLTAGGG